MNETFDYNGFGSTQRFNIKAGKTAQKGFKDLRISSVKGRYDVIYKQNCFRLYKHLNVAFKCNISISVLNISKL